MDLLTAQDGWWIQTKHKDLDYLWTHALGILTQGQACELDMASHPEGFGWGLRQRQNNKSIL